MKLSEMNTETPFVFESKDITFAGIELSRSAENKILTYQEDNNIPNPNTKKLHITLLYSRKYLPEYQAFGEMSEMADPAGWDVFVHGNNRALILRLDCPYLEERFKYLKDKHQASFDYEEYKPHITFSYDVGDFDEKTLPAFKHKIKMIKEYRRDFAEDS